MITVFFDGKCGLCRREIALYRRLDTAGSIIWVDVMNDAELAPYPLPRDAALRAIHVLKDGKTWQTGADAFVLIWKALPAFRVLGRLVSLPFILSVARWVYRLFGAVRYRVHGYDRCDL